MKIISEKKELSNEQLEKVSGGNNYAIEGGFVYTIDGVDREFLESEKNGSI